MSTSSASEASGASLTSETSRLRTSDPRILVLFAILLGYVLWPILQVLGESFWVRGEGPSLGPWREFLQRGHLVYAWRSLTISLATVALSGIFGTALAFLYFRLEFPGRAILSGLALLPFTLPPLVGVFAIWTLMGEDGLFHQFTRAIYGDGLWLDKGYGGVLLIHTYSMYVYFYVLVGGALAGFDESQIEAARDLGATRWKTMTRIVAPQLAPALAGASLLTFMTSMASFTAPFFYMAGRPVLTVGIQQAWENNTPGLASADCVVLALCAGIFLYLILKYEKTIQGGTRGAARRRVEVRSLPLRFSIALGAMALTFLLLAPHIAMVREALVKPGTGFVGVPVEYSVVNFLDLWRKDQSWRPILTSLKAAGLATFAVILFTLFSSWVIVRREFYGKALMRWLVMVPWALPGTVIAIGLLWISRSANLLTLGANIRGTIQILALAYFIRLMPLAHRTITAGLSRVSKELEGAGRDLGAGPLQSFLRITLPLIFPAVIAAATLTFATAMGEFVSSILLTGFENEPISVKIFELRRERVQLAAAYSTILLAMITLTFAVFGRRLNRAM